MKIVLIGAFACAASFLIACTSTSGDKASESGAAVSNTNQSPIEQNATDDNAAKADNGATCLSTTPIDPAQFGYAPARPPQPGACTSGELTALSAYYREHAADDYLGVDWKTSVSAGCAACAFSWENDTSWGPITINAGGELGGIDRGGCIEQVSGNEACGRSYQQLQDCEQSACLETCQTQEEFTKCRQDARVLTTSCKAAYDNLKSSCDMTKIGAWETKCHSTTYTFEGPIRVACVTGPSN